MSKMSCIIVEDEKPSVEELKYIISQYDLIEIKGTANDGEEGLNLFNKMNPDIVFLDINIPIINGMDLAKKIKSSDEGTSIVFITAYEQHAVEAFEINAADYILKPFDEKRIYKTLKKLTDKKADENKDDLSNELKEFMGKIDREEKLLKKIPCEYHGKTILVDLKDIQYCFIEDEATYVKTKDKKYYTSYALHEIETKTDLFRAHRSFLVNMDNVKELYPWFHGTYKLIMNDCEKSEVPVSRNNVRKLKDIIGL